MSVGNPCPVKHVCVRTLHISIITKNTKISVVAVLIASAVLPEVRNRECPDLVVKGGDS